MTMEKNMKNKQQADIERAKELFWKVAEHIENKADEDMNGLSYAEALVKLSGEEKAKWFRAFVRKNGIKDMAKKYWKEEDQ